MKLYFARHGHMDASPDTPLDPEVGQINEPLDDKGIQQANTLAEELKNISFDAIVSSRLKRAYETAAIVNKYHNLSAEMDDAWRERDTGGFVTPDVWDDLFDFDKNIQRENTEELGVFFKRVYDAVDKLKMRFPDGTVLVVSHGGVNQAVYAYANNLPLVGYIRNDPLHNCELRIYEI